MRLLFDQNLSRTLVGALRDVFPENQHVTALGFDTATDRKICLCNIADPVESVRRPRNDETPAVAGVSLQSG